MIRSKTSLLVVALFSFTVIFVDISHANGSSRSDRKTLPGNMCTGSGVTRDDLDKLPIFLKFAEGGGFAETHVTVTCPIIKDISRSRKIKFRVNLIQGSRSFPNFPDTNTYKVKRTRCFLVDTDTKTNRTRFHLLDINGSGRVSAERKVYISSGTDSLAFYCHIAKGNTLLSYSYIESGRK